MTQSQSSKGRRLWLLLIPALATAMVVALVILGKHGQEDSGQSARSTPTTSTQPAASGIATGFDAMPLPPSKDNEAISALEIAHSGRLVVGTAGGSLEVRDPNNQYSALASRH